MNTQKKTQDETILSVESSISELNDLLTQYEKILKGEIIINEIRETIYALNEVHQKMIENREINRRKSQLPDFYRDLEKFQHTDKDALRSKIHKVKIKDTPLILRKTPKKTSSKERRDKIKLQRKFGHKRKTTESAESLKSPKSFKRKFNKKKQKKIKGKRINETRLKKK